MKCPKCNEEMENKWNVSWIIYTSYPAQRDETRVCHKCQCKTTERVRWQSYEVNKYENYTDV
jgi:hypothetical protein